MCKTLASLDINEIQAGRAKQGYTGRLNALILPLIPIMIAARSFYASSRDLTSKEAKPVFNRS